MPTLGLHLAITVTRLRGGTPPPPPVFAQLPITWTDNSSIEDGYRVKYEPTSGGIQLQIELAANSTAATIDGLLFNTQYDIEVVAYNEVGESLALGPVAIYTPPPAAPTVCTATATGSTTATIGWTAPGTAPVTGYRIYRSPHGAGTWTAAGVVAAGVNSFGDTGLTASTQYDWRVVAYNSNSGVSQPDSETDPSNTATATTLSGGGAWYDAALYADATGNADTDSAWLLTQAVSLSAGTTTKVRVGIGAWQLSHKILVGLYDSSGNLVIGTAATTTTGDGVMEIDWTSSQSVSAATYYVGITVQTSNVFKIARESGGTPNSRISNISPGYTLPDPFPAPWYTTSSTLCVGVWVE